MSKTKQVPEDHKYIMAAPGTQELIIHPDVKVLKVTSPGSLRAYYLRRLPGGQLQLT